MDVDKVLPLVYTIILDDKVVFADADVLNRNIGCCEGAARQQEEDWKRVKPLVEAAQEVMSLLEEHGPSIVPHLLDTDENAGQRLREALAQLGEGMIADGEKKEG